MIALFMLVGSVGYYFIGNGSGDEPATPTGQITRVVNVTKGDLNLVVSANGVVQPIDRVEIKSKASGQIEEMNFEEGQLVKKGDLLIALDQRTAKNDYDQAKADLAVAESNLQQQENNHRRAVELFEKSLISEQERDQANLEKVRADAQVVKASATLSSADERLRDTRVISPITGIILTKNIALGQIISSGVSNVGGGTLLATGADMNEVHVETNVDEVDIGKVLVGQQAKVVADAYPDESFTGEVIRIAPLGKTQQNVTTFNVIVLVKNLGGRLKAGMSTSVDVEIFNRRQVLLVPAEALKDPRSEQGQAMLASMKKPVEQEEAAKKDTGASGVRLAEGMSSDPGEMRKRFMSMSPEEQQKFREQMRERVQKMSPEERQKYFSQMRERFGGAQGGGGGTMFRREGGEEGGSMNMRVRRESQVGKEDAVRERVVMVKQENEFVPKVVKVGASNFDFAEVLEGLKEGDEIQITTISRAKIAAEQFNERMRSMSGMGGIGGGGGGAARAATGRGR